MALLALLACSLLARLGVPQCARSLVSGRAQVDPEPEATTGQDKARKEP